MPSISQMPGCAVVVLPEDVGLAVAVEVAGAGDLPGRARVRADRGLTRTGMMPFISQTPG